MAHATPKKQSSIATHPLLRGILTLGVVIPLGILSYTGMMFIYPSEILGWAAFFLNGFVDGEVYLDNISGGLKDWQLLGKKGVEELLIKALHTHLNNNPPSKNASPLEKAYWDARLKADADPENSKLVRTVESLQSFFVKHVLSENLNIQNNKNLKQSNTSNNPLANGFGWLERIRTQLPWMQWKVVALRVALVISILSGIGFGLVTAMALASVVMMSTETLLLFSVLAVCSLTASLGYALLTFHNMKRIIFSETFEKWQMLFKDWFFEKPKSMSRFTYVIRLASALILIPTAIALSVIATLTTGYTWWIAMEGLALRKVIVPITIFTNFLFAAKNSLDSVREIQNGFIYFLDHPFKSTREQFAELLANENIAQLINPFRIIDKAITFTFDYALLIAHSIAVALTGDRYPGYERSSLAGGAIADFFIDESYMGGEDHDHDEASHHPKKLSPKIADEDEHHSHTIPKIIQAYLIDPIMYPWRLVAITWDMAASQLQTEPTKVILTYREAYNKYFEPAHSHEHKHDDQHACGAHTHKRAHEQMKGDDTHSPRRKAVNDAKQKGEGRNDGYAGIYPPSGASNKHSPRLFSTKDAAELGPGIPTANPRFQVNAK